MMGAMLNTKRTVSEKRAKPASVRLPKKIRAKKATGTMLRIVKGKPTDQKISAAEAFGDLDQAREQVLYAERHGSLEEKRLVRLAFRQYQGMRSRAK